MMTVTFGNLKIKLKTLLQQDHLKVHLEALHLVVMPRKNQHKPLRELYNLKNNICAIQVQ